MSIIIQPGDFLKDGRYEIKQYLGEGREKKIFLAYDRDLDCLVALDAFSSNNPVMPGGQALNAWEARMLGHLGDHPNIATVLDRWNEGETAFMTTRYLPGELSKISSPIRVNRASPCQLMTSCGSQQKSRTGLPTSTAAASCIWTCSQKTYASTSGARSASLTSTPQCRSMTPAKWISLTAR